MDNLKFKAWIDKDVPDKWDEVTRTWSDKRESFMADVKSIHLGTGNIIISDKYGNHSEPPENYTLRQWTGLTDIYEVDIYAGDIVNIDDQLYVVVWNINGLWCYKHATKEHLVSGFDYWKSNIVGDMYQNPELVSWL